MVELKLVYLRDKSLTGGITSMATGQSFDSKWKDRTNLSTDLQLN